MVMTEEEKVLENFEVSEKISKVTENHFELTSDNSTEYSLQVILDDPDDKFIHQEILELAVHFTVRSYSNNLFTHPSEKILRNFQQSLMSKDINCQFIFKSPKPLS